MRNIFIREKSSELPEDIQSQKSINYAYGLIITVTVIILFGLTMLYSTSSGTVGTKFFYNQLMWSLIGFMAGAFVFTLGHKKLGEYSMLLIIAATILLIIADFCFPAVKGAHRWIRIKFIGGPMSIQPSELAKIAIALYISKYCADNLRFVNEIFCREGPVKPCIVCGIVIFFVLAGKDLGTTILLISVCMIVFFAAGMRLLYILPPIIFGGPLLFIIIKKFDPMRWARLTTFLNPESDLQDEGYQLWNSLLALGSGKWFGIGFMESRLKAKYLPEAHTDFILSIVGEELGLISLCLVALAYIVFLYFSIKISLNSRTRQGMLLGLAITSALIFQAIINIGVVSGGLPTKGMPAPFISYGGSNLVMCLTGVGLLLNIAAETASPGFNDEILAAIKNKFAFLAFFRRKK